MPGASASRIEATGWPVHQCCRLASKIGRHTRLPVTIGERYEGLVGQRQAGRLAPSKSACSSEAPSNASIARSASSARRVPKRTRSPTAPLRVPKKSSSRHGAKSRARAAAIRRTVRTRPGGVKDAVHRAPGGFVGRLHGREVRVGPT